MNRLPIRNHMDPHKALNVAFGLMIIAGIVAGYWLGVSQEHSSVVTMVSLFHSEKNVETVLYIKVLEGLRESQIEDTIQFLQAGVKGALKYDRIEAATLDRAREYQRKYCKTPCLGIP